MQRLLRLAVVIGLAPTVLWPGASDHWQNLPSLPDEIGFAGMFAGNLGGRLVAGGGSQFHPRPVWLGGQKRYNDRIFVLDHPAGAWRVADTRLLREACCFAHATTEDAIFIVGGLGAAGTLKSFFAIRAAGSEFSVERLPDFPHAVAHAAAAIVADRLYVCGGLRQPTDGFASAEMWSFPLAAVAPEWEREQDFPGVPAFAAAAAGRGNDLYLFGGMGFDSAGQLRPLAAAYRYSTVAERWEELPAMPAPRVGSASPCPADASGQLLVIGGYAEVFPGALRDHPGFSRQVFAFDPVGRKWRNGPLLPARQIADADAPSDSDPGPMMMAPCVRWNKLAVVIGGESRASVRTPAVLGWPLDTVDPLRRD